VTIERAEPSFLLDERAMLDGWLDYHRATLLVKCEGLTHDQLRQRSVPPSSLSLLGLVRHMTEVERWWFAAAIAGERHEFIYCTDDRPDGDFDDVDTADVDADLAAFDAECAHSRAIARSRRLDDRGAHPRRREPVALRWVMTHMIEEYARHNGHADLLREQIDGATGD
jgi:hypothetical protein